MHNIKLIRKEPDFFLKKLGQRNIKIGLKSILDLDKKNRELIQSKEKLEQEKKIISKKKDKSQFSRSKEISKKIELLDKTQTKIKNCQFLLHFFFSHFFHFWSKISFFLGALFIASSISCKS